MSGRCERWLNADELLGPRHKIDPRDVHVCGKPAVADVLERHHEDWTACDEHATEAEREGANVERYDGSSESEERRLVRPMWHT